MSLDRARALERLVDDQRPCLGAAFLTYAFDPEFFEDHVLRAVLRLVSDPFEQPRVYGEDLRAGLQQTPVVVFADASLRQPGRRGPYDLVEIRNRTFHPKLALLLYEDRARLQIGSGNLTKGGYGDNVELCTVLELRYAEPDDRMLLRDLQHELARLAADVPPGAQQLALVHAELLRRLGPPRDEDLGRATGYRLLSSARHGALLPRVLEMIPRGARVTRMGVLAPFWELDDSDALEGDGSVLGAIAAHLGRGIAIDLGVIWENSPVDRLEPETGLSDGFGRLWAWRTVEDGEESLEILTPTKLTDAQLHFIDHRGESRRWPRKDTERALAQGHLWRAPEPIVFAPQSAIAAARRAFSEVCLWLHPASRLVDGRHIRRPLHAKLFAIAYEQRGRERTLLMLGSPNASRAALLRGASEGGNDEIAIAFVVEGTFTLTDLLPELVFAPEGALVLRERVFPERAAVLGAAVSSAVFDPASGILRIEWEPTVELGPWTLAYLDRELARGEARPGEPTLIEAFVLEPMSSELVLQSGDREATVPILVTDLIALPSHPVVASLDLRDLLLLLGRRIGREKLFDLKATRGPAGDEVLDSVFGEDFTPTDVFRAWWNLAEDLGEEDLPLQAFRVRLHGPLGAAAVWQRMLAGIEDLAESSRRTVGAVEAWFYGAELRRTLLGIRLGEGLLEAAKRDALQELLGVLEADLARIAPPSGADRPWVARMRRFYEEDVR